MTPSKVKFVILSHQRAGSTYLVSMLNAIPGLVCHSELFNRGEKAFTDSIFDREILPTLNILDKLRGRSPEKKLFDIKNRNPVSFLDYIYQSSHQSVGFKFFPGQHLQVCNSLIENGDIRKILLVRENLLRAFVSKQIAWETGKWARYKGEEASLDSVVINPATFRNFARKHQLTFQDIEQRLTDSGQDYCLLTYEQIVNGFPLKVICDFLSTSVPDRMPKTHHRRQNPFQIHEMVQNYDEVSQALKGTEYEKYLEE